MISSMGYWTAPVVVGLAAAAAVSFTASTSANASGQCADQIAGNLRTYYTCIAQASARCTESGGAFAGTLGIVRGHITCVYPDGSRDECDYNGVPGYGNGTCDNIQPEED
jgi:hypothetical protein